MNSVAILQKQIDKKDLEVRRYSIIDMILDPSKKKAVDDYYDRNYEYIEKDDFAKKFFENKTKK
jgi:hypothetical protein